MTAEDELREQLAQAEEDLEEERRRRRALERGRGEPEMIGDLAADLLSRAVWNAALSLERERKART